MVDTLADSSRQGLRHLLIARRNSIGAAAAAAAARAVARHCSTLLQGMRHVAGYLAMPGELDVQPLLSECRSQGMQTYAPVIRQSQLLFAAFDDGTPLREGRFGILIPEHTPEQCRAPCEMDAVLVPLVGFDSRCHRVGMGGGFYDRSFAFRRERQPPPWLIGSAFQCQRVPAVPVDWWDVPLDQIVTEAGIIRPE